MESCNKGMEQMTIVDGLVELSNRIMNSGAIATPEDQQSYPFKHSDLKSKIAASFSNPSTNIAGYMPIVPPPPPSSPEASSFGQFTNTAGMLSTVPAPPPSSPVPSSSSTSFSNIAGPPPSPHFSVDAQSPVHNWRQKMDRFKRCMDTFEDDYITPAKKHC